MRTLVLPVWLAAVLTVSPLLAWAGTDVWVDPVLGSDAALGTEAEPFKTLTFALNGRTPGSTVHLMPGTYGPAGGEVFPITIPPNVLVASTTGKASTLLYGRADRSLLGLQPGATLDGVTLEHSGSPMIAERSGSPTQLIRNCDIGGADWTVGHGSLDLEFCRFLPRQNSLTFDQQWGRVRATDCEFIGTPTSSLIRSSFPYYINWSVQTELTRCRVTGFDGGNVIYVNAGTSFVGYSLNIADSLITGNGQGALSLVDLYGRLNVTVDGSTIAGNGGAGVAVHGTPNVEVRSSIIAQNAAGDLFAGAIVEASLIGDGSAGASVPGVLTGNPRFVSPATGDWSLRFDSPCIDRALDSAARQDVSGNTRTVDGDLDLFSGADMGALEHQTLRAPKSIDAAELLELGVTGPAMGFSTIIVAPKGYASHGAVTPYGRIFLEPQGLFRLTPILTTGGGPTTVDATSIIDPAWIGTTVGFQALTRSFNSSSGGAYSNPLLVTFTP